MHLLEVEPLDHSDVGDNYRAICQELKRYSSVLATKPQIVVLNKLDLLQTDADRKVAIELVEHAIGMKVIPISAVTGDGCRNLLESCWKVLCDEPRAPCEGCGPREGHGPRESRAPHEGHGPREGRDPREGHGPRESRAPREGHDGGAKPNNGP